jgi:hypothetical protein
VSVVARLLALDAAWFTRVLRAGGHSVAAVTDVAAAALTFAGNSADIARFTLSYVSGGAPGPGSVIAKIKGVRPTQVAMEAAMGLYEREARFYTELAPDVPLRAPRCYYAGDGTEEPLLLEDLGGLRAGDQMRGLTVADAEALMDALGDFHAAYWEAPAIRADWVASPAEGVFAEMIVHLVGSGVPALRARYQGRVADEVLDAVARIAPRWRELLSLCAQGPRTLVHNDCRLDNIFFDEDGAPVLVDWQLLARTRGTQDVGNLLAGSMDSADLRQNWEALLRRYHARLVARGVRRYGWEECRAHYRQNILYPLGAGIALLGNLDNGDSRGLGDVIVLRTLAHCADLDSFSIL